MSNLTLIPAYLGNAQHGEDFYIGIPGSDFLDIAAMSVAGRGSVSGMSSVGAAGDGVTTGKIKLGDYGPQANQPGQLGGPQSFLSNPNAVSATTLPTLGQPAAASAAPLMTATAPTAPATATGTNSTLTTSTTARNRDIAIAAGVFGVALIVILSGSSHKESATVNRP